MPFITVFIGFQDEEYCILENCVILLTEAT